MGGVGRLIGSKAPKLLVQIFDFMQIFAGDIAFIKPNCISPAPYHLTFWSQIGFSVGIGLPMVVGIFVVRWFYRRHAKAVRKSPEAVKLRELFYKQRAKRCVMMWVNLSYLTLSTLAFKGIYCVKDESKGVATLAYDRSYVCFRTWQHWSVVLMSIVLLCTLTIGYPAGVFVLMLRNVKSGRLFDDPVFTEAFNDTISSYKRNRWWYNQIDITVLFGIAAATALLQLNPLLKFAFIASIVGAAFVLLSAIRPFERKWQQFLFTGVQLENLLLVVYPFLADSNKVPPALLETLKWTQVTLGAAILLEMTVVAAYWVFFRKTNAWVYGHFSTDWVPYVEPPKAKSGRRIHRAGEMTKDEENLRLALGKGTSSTSDEVVVVTNLMLGEPEEPVIVMEEVEVKEEVEGGAEASAVLLSQPSPASLTGPLAAVKIAKKIAGRGSRGSGSPVPPAEDNKILQQGLSPSEKRRREDSEFARNASVMLASKVETSLAAVNRIFSTPPPSRKNSSGVAPSGEMEGILSTEPKASPFENLSLVAGGSGVQASPGPQKLGLEAGASASASGSQPLAALPARRKAVTIGGLPSKAGGLLGRSSALKDGLAATTSSPSLLSSSGAAASESAELRQWHSQSSVLSFGKGKDAASLGHSAAPGLKSKVEKAKTSLAALFSGSPRPSRVLKTKSTVDELAEVLESLEVKDSHGRSSGETPSGGTSPSPGVPPKSRSGSPMWAQPRSSLIKSPSTASNGFLGDFLAQSPRISPSPSMEVINLRAVDVPSSSSAMLAPPAVPASPAIRQAPAVVPPADVTSLRRNLMTASVPDQRQRRRSAGPGIAVQIPSDPEPPPGVIMSPAVARRQRFEEIIAASPGVNRRRSDE
jgi:hypothetical protein